MVCRLSIKKSNILFLMPFVYATLQELDKRHMTKWRARHNPLEANTLSYLDQVRTGTVVCILHQRLLSCNLDCDRNTQVFLQPYQNCKPSLTVYCNITTMPREEVFAYVKWGLALLVDDVIGRTESASVSNHARWTKLCYVTLRFYFNLTLYSR